MDTILSKQILIALKEQLDQVEAQSAALRAADFPTNSKQLTGYIRDCLSDLTIAKNELNLAIQSVLEEDMTAAMRSTEVASLYSDKVFARQWPATISAKPVLEVPAPHRENRRSFLLSADL